LLVAFGVVGLVYMILHDVISARFFLIFSPVFIVYISCHAGCSDW
jgi:hypothetical protein